LLVGRSLDAVLMIPLDPMNPPSGDFVLDGDKQYQLLKPKSLGGAHWRGVGGTNPPLVVYNGGRDSYALASKSGMNPTIDRVDFQLAPWAYALASGGSMSASNIRVKGGGGILLAQAAPGVTRLTNVELLEPSNNYGIEIGGKSTSTPTTYTEADTDTVVLESVKLRSSLQMAAARFSAMRRLEIRKCDFDDSVVAPHAVPNSVLRIHGNLAATMDVVIEDSHFKGTAVFFGPYQYDKDSPAGPMRNASAKRRVRSLTVTRCKFDVREIHIPPGVTAFEFNDCDFVAGTPQIITADDPVLYLVRQISAGKVVNCRYTSRVNHSPWLFASTNNNKSGMAQMFDGGGNKPVPLADVHWTK
jgi:hypothetical protein